MGTLPPRGAIELMHYNMPQFDILAVCNVPHDDVLNVAFEFFGRYNALYSSHEGATDNLILAWSDRFQPRAMIELREVEGQPLRPAFERLPIGARLYDTTTGHEFLLVHVHFPEQGQFENADLLNRWAASQSVPVFLVGTFNAKVDVNSGLVGAELTPLIGPEAHFQWIRPEALVDSGWDDADGDGVDDAPDSVQHMALGPRDSDWQASSRFVPGIVTRPSPYSSVQVPLLTRIEPPPAR